MPSFTAPATGAATCLAAWLVGIGLGFSGLLHYSSQPGEIGEPVLSWPAESPIARHQHGADLLMFAHAQCPCTRASLSELERALAHAPRSLRCRVVVWSDDEADASFADSPIRRRADAMQRVEVIDDPGGRITNIFGARTSGHVLHFSANGELLYSGGLTAARGHEGDNRGSDLLLQQWSNHPTAGTASAAVFGCSFDQLKP